MEDSYGKISEASAPLKTTAWNSAAKIWTAFTVGIAQKERSTFLSQWPHRIYGYWLVFLSPHRKATNNRKKNQILP